MRFAYIVEPALIGFILMTPHKWMFISRYSNMSPRLSRCSLAYLSVFRRHVMFDVGWCSYQAKSSNSVVLCVWSLEQVPSSLHPVSLVCPSICSRCLSTQKNEKYLDMARLMMPNSSCAIVPTHKPAYVVDRPLRFSYLSRLAASGALAEFRCGHLTD